MSQGMVMDPEDVAPGSTVLPSASGLQHQGCLTLSRALSKKTVDEAWRNIQQGERSNNGAHKQQPTLGEMRLEDFLAKAGLAGEGLDKNKRGIADGKNLEVPENICNVGSVDPMMVTHNFSEQPRWLEYQIPNSHHQPQNQQQNLMGAYMPSRPSAQALGPGPLLDVTYPDQMVISSPLMGTFSDTQTPGRKRLAPGDVVGKTVERRQKRMIKNRESAARSRARKQAYTNELAIKVSRLEEENERLRKQKITGLVIRVREGSIYRSHEGFFLGRSWRRFCTVPPHLSRNFDLEEPVLPFFDYVKRSLDFIELSGVYFS